MNALNNDDDDDADNSNNGCGDGGIGGPQSIIVSPSSIHLPRMLKKTCFSAQKERIATERKNQEQKK